MALMFTVMRNIFKEVMLKWTLELVLAFSFSIFLGRKFTYEAPQLTQQYFIKSRHKIRHY